MRLTCKAVNLEQQIALHNVSGPHQSVDSLKKKTEVPKEDGILTPGGLWT